LERNPPLDHVLWWWARWRPSPFRCLCSFFINLSFLSFYHRSAIHVASSCKPTNLIERNMLVPQNTIYAFIECVVSA
jgi:hypothetical protein